MTDKKDRIEANYQFYYLFLIVLFGLSIVGLGATIFSLTDWMEKYNGSVVLGTVSAIINSDSTSYEVEYVVDNNTYKVKTITAGFSQTKRNIGDKVEVRYSTPDDSVINTFTERYTPLLFSTFMTTIFFCGGLLVKKFKKWALRQDGSYWPYG